MRQRIRPVLFTLGALLVVYFLFSKLAAQLIYYPMKYPAGDWAVGAGMGAEERWLTASDGVRIHGWWIAVPESKVATIFLHGNAGNITHRGRHAEQITGAGSSLLLMDYRGYGRSEGSPSEKGLYADADAAYDSVIAEGYAPHQIILHGESLGTAVAMELAVRRGCGGVILESPLRSAGRIAGGILPFFGPMLVRGFDTESRIAQLRAPLLVVHGNRDEVVPFSHGKAIFEAAPEPKWFWEVEGGNHNDLLFTGAKEYRQRLRDFYSKVNSPSR
jgi:uncharacterized protein